MDETDYYLAYKCLEILVLKRKITSRVANKILKELEREINPLFPHSFK